MIYGTLTGTQYKAVQAWAEKLVSECKVAFQDLLPFNEQEQLFLTHIEEQVEIKPELLLPDESFCQQGKCHPLLRWRIQQRNLR